MNTYLRSIYIVMLFFVTASFNLSAQVVVNNVTELLSALSTASDNEVINLDPNFTSSSVTIPMPAVAVTIDGGDYVWETGSITITGGSSGHLTIRNLKINGTSISSKLLKNNASNGQLTLDHMEFYNAQSGAIDISTSGSAFTLISYTKIHNNTANNTPPAIWTGGGSILEIANSTIENNIGTGGGWESGAIASKNYTGELMINNSVFRNNVNKSVNTGIFGGGGGAMSMHYLKGSIHISECLFEGNKTNGEDTEIKSTYDGGAIYIFDGRDGAVVNIVSSTFTENVAYDDGGAIMFQGTGNPGLTTSIVNCTFYKNRAHGADGAGYAGGAIQYFKNGGSSKMVNNILSSTFVGNIGGSEQTTTEQRGGAIGLSGAGILATAAVTRNGCLFVGNQVYGVDGKINDASTNKDISLNATTQAGTYNVINVDKGDAPAYTAEDVLGRNYSFCENLSGIKAGVDGEIIKTIPIKPEGIADMTYSGATSVPYTDQRNFTRNKDQGAIEMAWVRFNAGEGEWTGLNDNLMYEGTDYYESVSQKAKYYYRITNSGGTVTSPDSESGVTLAPPSGLEFDKWVWEKDSTTEWKPTDVIVDSLRVVAIYKTATQARYKVLYEPNGGGGTAIAHECDENDQHTILNYNDGSIGFTPPTSNHVFAGWKDSQGNPFTVNTSYTFTSDTTLYAQWKESSPITIIYDSGIGTGDDKIFTTAKDGSHTILEYTNPTIDFKPSSPNHSFVCWKDSLGNIYTIGESYVFTTQTRLIAQWQEDKPSITDCAITYYPNGGGGTVQTISNAPDCSYKILNYVDSPLYFTAPNANYEFVNWNTKADGSGTSYEVGVTVTAKDHLELYAQWKRTSSPGDNAGIEIHPLLPFCSTDAWIHIPYDILLTSPMEYTVIFSEEAKKAGFKDIDVFTELPSNYITVPMPNGVSKGKYAGKIVLRTTDNTSIITDYPFELEVLGGVVIVNQPESTRACKEESFTLNVDASDDALSYQWYFEGEKIAGATLSQYSQTITSETEGMYYVIVSGTCGSLKSDSVYVSMNTLSVLIKWDDVLYVDNTDGKYVKFQWFKNGQEIPENGTFVYYTDEAGLDGSYHVRAYYADGTFDESCPVRFTSDTTKAILKVYPNPVSNNSHLTVEGVNGLSEGGNYQVELYDLSGRRVYATTSFTETTQIPIHTSPGVYLLNVTAPNGKRTVKKVVVK